MRLNPRGTPVLALLTALFALPLAAAEPAEAPKPPADPPAPLAATPPAAAPARQADSADLRTLIGVNPVGLKRVDIPRMPTMSLRGFVQPHGGLAVALLEIAELNRIFLVQVGTEIPILVPGRISPVGRAELTGLISPGKFPTTQPRSPEGKEQSQIVLKVLKVSNEGVLVEAGLLGQTIIIR